MHDNTSIKFSIIVIMCSPRSNNNWQAVKLSFTIYTPTKMANLQQIQPFHDINNKQNVYFRLLRYTLLKPQE